MSYLDDFKSTIISFSSSLTNEEKHKLDQQDTWEHLLSSTTPKEPKVIKMNLNGKLIKLKIVKTIATQPDISFNHIRLSHTIPTLQKLRTIYLNISTKPINLSDFIYELMDYSF